jgi:hypothetical protein
MMGVHQGAHPATPAPRRSRPGTGFKVVQRMRCSTLTPVPGLRWGKLADATGYPLRSSLRQANTRVLTISP